MSAYEEELEQAIAQRLNDTVPELQGRAFATSAFGQQEPADWPAAMVVDMGFDALSNDNVDLEFYSLGNEQIAIVVFVGSGANDPSLGADGGFAIGEKCRAMIQGWTPSLTNQATTRGIFPGVFRRRRPYQTDQGSFCPVYQFEFGIWVASGVY